MTTRQHGGRVVGGVPRLARWAAPGALLLGLVLFYALGLHRYLGLDALRRYGAHLHEVVAAKPLASAGCYTALYVAAVAISFPGASFFTITGGFLFGWAAGTALALLAATSGAALIFVIARTSFGEVLAARAGPRVQRLREGFQEEGFSYLLFLRLAPVFPFWLVNLAAALFGIRLMPYLTATIIGILPGTFVLAYFGEGLRTALDHEGSPFSAKLLIGLGLLALMALVPVIVRRRRAKGGQERPI